MGSADLHHSAAEGETFTFLTYMYLSPMYSPIFSDSLCMANLNVWDALEMSIFDEGTLPLVLGSLPVSVAEKFRDISAVPPFFPVVNEMDENGRPVSSGQLPLKIGW